jgi:Family of unknown function (DUF6065)
VNPETNPQPALPTRNSLSAIGSPPGEITPVSHFGDGIRTWHLPMLFRTPPGYKLLVRGPANYPKEAVYP